MKTAVIILGHGSRRQGSDASLETLVASLLKTGRYDIVAHAFLQYAEPALPPVVERCVGQGAVRIVVVPFFVQPGAHVTRDIPALAEDLRMRYPGVSFSVTGFVGAHPLMTDIVADLVDTNGAERGARSSK